MDEGAVVRGIALGFLVTIAGCAANGASNRTPEWQPRLEEQTKAQTRMELRLEEVTRNLLVLRERMDSLEASLANLASTEQARSAPARPPLRVVRLEPPAVAEASSGMPVQGIAAADLYRKAFNSYREDRFGQAILDFEDFLRAHPDHEYADNAQYWIGESYYSQGEFEQAVVEFGRVLDRYPQEAKAPDALLKMGLAYEKLGEPERSAVFWQRVVNEHPQSEAAVEARKRLNAAN